MLKIIKWQSGTLKIFIGYLSCAAMFSGCGLSSSSEPASTPTSYSNSHFALSSATCSSANGSTLNAGSSGCLQTAAGTWTFNSYTTSYGNPILLNNQPAAGGLAQELMIGSDGNLYALNTLSQWYEWTGSGWVSVTAPPPSGTPTPTPAPTPTPTSTPSSCAVADGSTLTVGATGCLQTAAGTWTFNSYTTSYGNPILLNNQPAAGGLAQELMIGNDGNLYALNTFSQWYEWTGSGWVAVTAPPTSGSPTPTPTPAPTPTPTSTPSSCAVADGSTLTVGASGCLQTAAGTWTFELYSTGFGNPILLNNQPAAGGLAQELMIGSDGNLYALNNLSQWYKWTGSGWASVTSPPGSGVPTPTPTPTPAPTATPSPYPTLGQSKPDGAPSSIALSDPALNGLLFYGLDEGNGTIADLSGQVTMTSFNPPSVVQTPYGKGFGWVSSNDQYPGSGYLGAITPAIYNATNLASQTTGASYTFAIAWYQTSAALDALIGGRPASAEEQPPYGNWIILSGNAPQGPTVASAIVDNNGTVEGLGNIDIGSFNVFSTAVIVAQNTAPGVATAKLYINGVLQTTTPGLNLSSTDPSKDPESQIMFGSIYHSGTGRSYGGCNCTPFEIMLMSNAWTDAQVADFHKNPYRTLGW